MNFTGRISATIPILIICIWLLQHTIKDDGTAKFIVSLTIAIIAIVIAWNFGRQYDKAKFYYKELLINKEDLQKKKDDLQQIFDSVDATIWSNDIVNQRIYVSKGIERLTGYTVQQFYNEYSFWTSILHPDDVTKGEEFLNEIFLGESAQIELRYVNTSGETFWVLMSGTPIFASDSKEVVKITGVVVDITERKNTEARLQESEIRYRSVVELSPNIILILQEDKIVYTNPTAVKILGLKDTSEILGESIYVFLDPAVKNKVINRKNEIYMEKGENVYTEYKIVKPDGKSIYIEMLGNKISYNGHPAIMVVGIDVTARKAYQEKITHMAYHDSLTGLPNRHLYNEYLEKAMERCFQNHRLLAVMYIDLDHFKFINDSMGHGAGDELLKLVSARLLRGVREGDFVSRLGGDEFAILLEVFEEHDVREIADRILHTFSTPFMIKGKEFFTSPSIGISICPLDGEDKETIMSKADTAMYLAKKKGKNNYQFYSKQQGDLIIRKNKIEQNLRRALKQNEFYLEYQPKLELNTGSIYAVEALIRWDCKELGSVSPNEFIPIVEECGMILTLGKWILNAACKQNKIWLDAGIKVKMAVNVSALQFEDENFINVVTEILGKHQLSPQYLGLEITESVMQNFEKSTIIFNRLKEIGVKISIDDFGTGYSSLSVLSNLPIDFVKIDKTFINEVTTKSNIASLVKTMIEMGGNLGFDLIAEGIEKQEEAEFLIANGCRFGQGYFYCPPLGPAEVEKLLKEKRIIV